MSNWLNSTAARAEKIDDWLAPKRRPSLQLLQASQWPTRKTEAWKYLPVAAWERAQLSDAEPSVEAEESYKIDALGSIDLVVKDGVLLPGSLPAQLPQGLSVDSLAQSEGATSNWVAETFATIKPSHHLFGLVNDTLATDGVVIDVAAQAKIEQPIRIIYLNSAGSESHSRVIVRLGQGSEVAVIEHSVGNQLSRNTAYAEYRVGEQARLEHYRLALQSGSSMSIGGSHFELLEAAELNSTLVGFGSALSRLDVDVNHKGEHAKAKINAIYLLDGKEMFDLHSTIEHSVANGTTEENVRGIVADHARAIFNGRIHIHRYAQKTLAELNNRNLLLSDKAEINTKPELEIYADDVRCAHGATIAEIDKKALFYLQSRGISAKQAKIMLNFGFINELVDDMPNAALAEWLRPQLQQRFARMEIR